MTPYSITAWISLSPHYFEKYLHAKARSRDSYDDWSEINENFTAEWLSIGGEGHDTDQGSHLEYFIRVLNEVRKSGDVFLFRYFKDEQVFFFYHLICYDWYSSVRSDLTILRGILPYIDSNGSSYIIMDYGDRLIGESCLEETFLTFENDKQKFSPIKNSLTLKQNQFIEKINNLIKTLWPDDNDLITYGYFQNPTCIEPILYDVYLKSLKV